MRIKSARSIWEKMLRLGVSLEGLHDICGVRVLVASISDCYAALETAHRLWPHLPDALDDYISSPKANGYQSLHTAVRLDCGHPLEIQIRTYLQHINSLAGKAAHWRYKQASTRGRGAVCRDPNENAPRGTRLRELKGET